MSARLFVEGASQGAHSKLLQSKCREGFRKLLEKSGFVGRLPQINACGSRSAAFRDFSTAHTHSVGNHFVGLLVDSEDPVANIEQTWIHLKARQPDWHRPARAIDEQVLLMTTCMESWIASDRNALREHYGDKLQVKALPNLFDMESRDRHSIQEALAHATRNCKNSYQKGKHSFDLLAKLNPNELRKHLPSFKRCLRILKAKL